MEVRIAQLEQQLRDLRIGGRTKDLTLAASIKEWSGNSKAKSVTEFLAQIEQCARVSGWNENDLVNILKAKLTGEALQFLNGRDQLTDENVTYEILKTALVDRFSEKLPARYHYNLLHEATQERDETPSQFLDKCRSLSSKTIRRGNNPVEQRILKEEAEFRLLTSFIYGMRGEAGRELRYRNPETLEQALNIATVVYNAKKLEHQHKNHETLAVKVEDKSSTPQRGPRSTWRRDRQPQRPPARRPRRQGNRNRDWVQTPVKCYACGRQGHIARFCDKREERVDRGQQKSPN
jgi:hypothetical protein